MQGIGGQQPKCSGGFIEGHVQYVIGVLFFPQRLSVFHIFQLLSIRKQKAFAVSLEACHRGEGVGHVQFTSPGVAEHGLVVGIDKLVFTDLQPLYLFIGQRSIGTVRHQCPGIEKTSRERLQQTLRRKNLDHTIAIAHYILQRDPFPGKTIFDAVVLIKGHVLVDRLGG